MVFFFFVQAIMALARAPPVAVSETVSESTGE
jgi:hypothetical protein